MTFYTTDHRVVWIGNTASHCIANDKWRLVAVLPFIICFALLTLATLTSISWRTRDSWQFLTYSVTAKDKIVYRVFVKQFQEEYSTRYPRGLNPVQVNDIFFAVHAVILTLFTIYQCAIYDRGDQRVSTTARVILGKLFHPVYLVNGAFFVLHFLAHPVGLDEQIRMT